jgi:hypothetical protein
MAIPTRYYTEEARMDTKKGRRIKLRTGMDSGIGIHATSTLTGLFSSK